MKSVRKFFGACAFAISSLALTVVPANASLMIDLSMTGSGGPFVNVAQNLVDNTSTGALLSSSPLRVVGLIGQDSFTGGGLMDVGLIWSGAAPSAFSIRYTQTNISLAGNAVFSVLFNSQIAGSSTVTRRLYLDVSNSGSMATLLATSTLGSGQYAEAIQSALQNINGPFSLTEQIDVVNAGTGTVLSLDDQVHVPEPQSVALMVVGLLSLLGFAMMRRRVNA